MTDKTNIRSLLKNYKPFDEDEKEMVSQTIQFVENNDNFFENNYKVGHIVGSAFVVNNNLEYILLNHHKIHNKWIQFGGHSDDHNIVADTAMREAHEESGLKNLSFHPAVTGIFDVDIHPIPKKENMPQHLHYDIRFLISADKNEPFNISSESKNIAWISINEIAKYNPHPAMMRAAQKIIRVKQQV